MQPALDYVESALAEADIAGPRLEQHGRHHPEEAPAHSVTVDGFWIDPTPVTNAAFRRFVKATGYVSIEAKGRNDGLPGTPE